MHAKLHLAYFCMIHCKCEFSYQFTANIFTTNNRLTNTDASRNYESFTVRHSRSAACGHRLCWSEEPRVDELPRSVRVGLPQPEFHGGRLHRFLPRSLLPRALPVHVNPKVLHKKVSVNWGGRPGELPPGRIIK